ncbi:MAG: hypothetical protein AB7G12_12215 [Thermoanaerobaculia bacterium]
MLRRFCAVAVLLAAAPPLPADLTPSGAIDPLFGGPTPGLFRYNRPDSTEVAGDLAIDSQGRLLVAFLVESSSEPGTHWPTVVRLTRDGATDPTFGFLGVWSESTTPAHAPSSVRIAVDSFDRPLVGWTYEFDQGGTPNRDWGLRRLTVSGANDLWKIVAFDLNGSGPGTRLDHLGDLMVWWDGRVIAVGDAQWSGDDTDFAVAVWAPDLSDDLHLDPTFDGDGRATAAFDVGGGIKADGALTVSPWGTGFAAAGYAATPGGTDVAVARFTLLGGGLDPSFGTGGRARFAHTPLGGTPWERQVAYGAAESPGDSSLILAGRADGPLNRQLAALKIDLSGNVVPTWGVFGWYVRDLRYPGFPFDAADSRADGIVVDPLGGALLAGGIYHPTSADSLAVAVHLTVQGTSDADFSLDGAEYYSFEPAGEPTESFFSGVALQPGLELTSAVVAGSMFGVTGGSSRTDWDAMASRIFVAPTIFVDGFESGNTSQWSLSQP